MGDKPKMYRLESGKMFHNNKCVYSSYSNNMSKNNIYDISEIRKKIDNLFSDSSFIYRTKVNIVLDNQIITKKIIGIYNNNLVTIDNEQIPINLIKDIYK